MTDQNILGTNLTSKQEAELLFYYDEDSNLWLYLLSEYFNSGGENSEVLKGGILSNSPEWQEIVKQVKERGLNDLQDMASNKILCWNLRFKQLCLDAGQVNLFSFYLRSLINLKTKKVAAIGGRGKTQQQINGLVSYLANNVYSYLERYVEAADRMKSGKTANGQDLSRVAKSYYESVQTDALREVTNLFGLLVIFKGAKSTEDIEVVQNLIRANMLKPLEIKSKTANNDEKKEMKGKIDSYYKLLQAMDIHF